MSPRPKRQKIRGVSTTVRTSQFDEDGIAMEDSILMKPRDLERHRRELRERVERQKIGRSRDSIRILEQIADQHSHSPMDDLQIPAGGTDSYLDATNADDMDWETLPDDESDSFVHALRDVLSDSRKTRVYKDAHTRKQQAESLAANWTSVLPQLVDTYLGWKYPSAQPNADSHSTLDGDPKYSLDIVVIDLHTLARVAHIPRTAESNVAAVAIAELGYLACTPVSPSMAISFKTLELFHRLRLRKASFSTEAFAKVIPYHRKYRDALDTAFDAYLAMLREIDRRVSGALGRDAPDWRAKNSCTACCYVLEDEPSLKFSRMYAFDGNNSLKRLKTLGGRQTADRREFSESDYYLSAEFVERYANEVRSRSKRTAQETGPSIPSPEVDPATGGDPTDAAAIDDAIAGCTKNWKSAAAEEKKSMWGIFDETGIFASACRHGLILWVADMVQSGELAKYPLAIVAKALELFEPWSLAGYDIGCAFATTIRSSSLGPSFQQKQGQICVNAFHGYTHNHACQTRWHPNVIEGMGLEDLETMERIFSSSNQLASITRYASRFRRRQFIDLFFRQWDADRYASLGNFLYNNYRQALDIIHEHSRGLQEVMFQLEIDEADLNRWQEEEAMYFATLGEEDERDVHAVAYVSLLEELREVDSKYRSTTSRFLTSIPDDTTLSAPQSSSHAGARSNAAEVSEARKIQASRRYLAERREQLLREIIDTEVSLNISSRWQPESPEYIAARQYTQTRDFHRALDKLQGLVVQRLFELHSLNLAQTAYRVRTYMAKSLQSRCKAIRNALATYNRLAVKMNPPQPPLDWTEVSHYSFLEEFALIRNTRNDLNGKPWVRPAVRAAMKQARRIARAREEIERLNVEVRRLHTGIVDESRFFDSVLTTLQTSGDPIHGAVEGFCKLRRRVGRQLLARLQDVYQLDGFSGNPVPGIHKGSSRIHDDAMGGMGRPETSGDVDEDCSDFSEVDDYDEDEGDRGISSIVDYISNLSVQEP